MLTFFSGCHTGSMIERLLREHYRTEYRNMHIKLLDEEKAAIQAENKEREEKRVKAQAENGAKDQAGQ